MVGTKIHTSSRIAEFRILCGTPEGKKYDHEIGLQAVIPING